jgi:hypothetical protein
MLRAYQSALNLIFAPSKNFSDHVGGVQSHWPGLGFAAPVTYIFTMEFLNGRPLSPDELERLRLEIESFDDILVVSAEVRGIVKKELASPASKTPARP